MQYFSTSVLVLEGKGSVTLLCVQAKYLVFYLRYLCCENSLYKGKQNRKIWPQGILNIPAVEFFPGKIIVEKSSRFWG